ncbi:MAG: thioredoxin domain-containing protein [Mariprofundaceae bacterium]
MLRLFILILMCWPCSTMAEVIVKKYTNALINQASPYLQQHAHNPVHWYPWGEEAFTKAKKEDKPIFLSIGYATCHWCHVMELESFDDEQVAAAMNKAFISIKVDREERPDIDQVYMQAAQVMGRQGGWPLNILMTPDKKPFYAATYIPKHSRGQRVGMLDLSAKVDELWLHDRNKLEQSAEQITQLLTQRNTDHGPGSKIDITELAKRATHDLKQSFDEQHGGFGSAPKFPSPHKLLFLLRQAYSQNDQKSLAMVEKTLDNMRAGGIYDQIGFGFHRYSTDNQWLVPHFEKMLYDQAMLLMAYSEAYQLTGHLRHAIVVREIAEYVLREMQDANGGFYSAEDADSEGIEGKFYVWRTNEIQALLGEKNTEQFAQVFNLSNTGNFDDEATGKATGANIPYLSQWGPTPLKQELEPMREALFKARDQRTHPFLDDKILTDWNGLMVAALAKASRALAEPKYLKAAQKCADFILKNMRDDQGHLWHRYRHGDVGIAAHLDDYAFFTWGLIELYQASFDSSYLKAAVDLNTDMLKSFTSKSGGLFLTAADAETLLVRPMEAWDDALPSGNAVAASNLLHLARLTSDHTLELAANRIFDTFSSLLNKAPVGFLHMISAQLFAANDSLEIVLAGDKNSAQAQSIRQTLEKLFLPHAVVIWRDQQSMQLIPFIKLQTPINNQITAYICKDFQCNQPVTNIDAMLKLMRP